MTTRPQPGDVVWRKRGGAFHVSRSGYWALCGQYMGHEHNVDFGRTAPPTCRTCLRIEAKQKGEQQ